MKDWFSDNSEHNPALYLRYVDDIFAIFRHGSDIDVFLNKINCSHQDIKFTVEEASDTLPFLDVEIKLNETNYDSWVWRKKSHTGIFLNYCGMATTKWKSGLIVCLLNRAWDICSDISYFHQETEKLKNMFIKNGYPIQLFTSAYERFWNSKNSNVKKDSTDSDIYIKIPFIGPTSVKFGKTLAVIFKETFDTTVEPVFTSFKVKTALD